MVKYDKKHQGETLVRKIWFIPVILLLLAGCTDSKESLAKDTAEAYMEAVQKGEDFEEISYTADTFHDVFDYEYLKTIEERKYKYTILITYANWESMHEDGKIPEYNTYEKYKDYQKNNFENYKVLVDNDEYLELWDGESYKYDYVLLYNVEIANEEGEKIYKKAEISLEDWFVIDGDDVEETYRIDDITLR